MRKFTKTILFLIILIIILLFLYSKYLGNTGLISKDYTITNNNIPSSFDNLKIVQFSDILFKDNSDINMFKDIRKKINSKKPDIVIFSGNLSYNKYNFTIDEINKIVEEFSKIDSIYGKYYINGIEDNDAYNDIMQKSGFISLNDTSEIIYSTKNEKILLAGYENSTDELDKSSKENINYKIIVFNKSDDFDNIKNYNYNLALSSNSLNGQVNIPLIKNIFLRDGSMNYVKPYYKYNNIDYYISSGIGTGYYEYRLFNKPSINLYKLKSSI